MNALQIFNYENKEVRTVMVDDELFFVAKDVCDVLGIDDVRQAVERIDCDDKLTGKIYHSGQNREMWIINESGLYSLILRSNKPEARRFKKWVTSEVLPSIRKTGSYSITGDTRKLMALALIEADKIIKEQAPKVEAFDTFMDADNALDMATVAGLFGLGRNNFMKMLRVAHILKKDNTPYVDYLHHFKPVLKSITKGDIIENVPVTLFRPSGVEYVMRRFNLQLVKQPLLSFDKKEKSNQQEACQ
ncbi:MAG: toxin-antitoxin system, toxin component, Bro family protein [Spirochaetae bacterium HGW-Spirochaetae-1]|jgi:prophage antirepressor-like protein|nr:MAG: toxin-antitoxin system, toxin component, Bro family protein [Spirochaetae bacterium HGW-Spirochaetae-1]